MIFLPSKKKSKMDEADALILIRTAGLKDSNCNEQCQKKIFKNADRKLLIQNHLLLDVSNRRLTTNFEINFLLSYQTSHEVFLPLGNLSNWHCCVTFINSLRSTLSFYVDPAPAEFENCETLNLLVMSV